MRLLQPLLHAYTAWSEYLPTVRGRGLILRAIDELQRLGVAAPLIKGEEGVTLELGGDYVARGVMYSGTWEPEETTLLRSVTPSGGTFIDVGANIGYFSLLASRWVGPNGLVFALEPVTSTYSRLRRNIALNHAANVQALQLGASSRESTSAAIALESDAGHSHLVRDGAAVGRHETISLTTIDALVERLGIARVDVLKIDVEGADFEVVRGAATTLSRFKPHVLMEVALIERFGTTLLDVQHFFDEIGYESVIKHHRSATDLFCTPRT